MMNDKLLVLFFIVFAGLYIIFTVFVLGHGIHFTNSVIALGLAIIGIYYYIKKQKEVK